MTYMNLIDVCDFQGGSQPPKDKWITQYKDGYIRMLQIRDFTQKRDERDYVEVSNRIKICKKDDVLIARYGASVGKILTGLEGAYNVAIIKSIPSKLIDKRYLYYYFNSSYFQNFLKNVGSRAAQAGFNKEDLREAKIFVPKIEHQRNIVSILNKSKNLIERRKNQIEQLDLLVKSKFIEMFRGDKNFDYIKIENLVEVKSDIVDGPFGSNLKTIDYVDSGVRVIQINNIGKSQFRNGNKRYITEEKFNSLIKHSVIPGDIVVAKMGEPIGRACIVPNWLEKAVIVADCMKIHPDLNVINAKYLEFLLNTDEVKVQFKKYSQGSTRVRLNLTMLRQIEVLYPPIELQNQFADFVKQVDKLKFEMEKSLKELEDNFNSLMNKAFKGELF
ncbi:restriction endonuclease subunit S [Clostridium perfringens]